MISNENKLAIIFAKSIDPEKRLNCTWDQYGIRRIYLDVPDIGSFIIEMKYSKEECAKYCKYKQLPRELLLMILEGMYPEKFIRMVPRIDV